MADKIVKRGISIFIDGKEVSNSVKAIGGELKKLQNEQAKMTIGADNYIAHAKKIEYLKSLLKEHADNQKKVAEQYKSMDTASEKYTKNTEGRLSRLANGFNKYWALFTTGLATVTGLTLGLKKFMDMRMELEDASANLKSLTGLGDNDIAWLRNYAKELSTTTTESGIRITATSKEIMDGFTLIGSKRPELLKNKEAMADLTKQALTLASTGVPVDQAFEVVTASLNQFNLEAKEGKRVINAIAAGSLAGSAEADSLAASLKNVGTVANDSNMTLEDTVAMLEVLASKQLTGEEAGTKLRGALLKLKEAGVGYASGQFSVRDALEEVNKKLSEHSSAAQRDALLQKTFGAENVTAGTILLQNVDAYDKLKVAVTGTNTAYDQAVIRTKTVSAQLAQAKNRMSEAGMELVQSLNPAMLKLANISNTVLNTLIKHPGLLWTIISAVGLLTLAYAAQYAVKVKNFAIDQAQNAFYAGQKVAVLSLAAAQALLTGNLGRFKAAMRLIQAELSLNPYVLLITAIAAVTIGIYKLATAKSVATKAFEEYNKQLIKETTQSDMLFAALKKTKEGTEQRKILIDKINSIYGEYLSHQLTEKSNLNDISLAQDEVNRGLREKIGLQMKEKASTEIVEKYTETMVSSLEVLRNNISKKYGDAIGDTVIANIKSIFANNPIDKAKALAADYMRSMAKQYNSEVFASGSVSVVSYANALKKMNSELQSTDKMFSGIIAKNDMVIYKPSKGSKTKNTTDNTTDNKPDPKPKHTTEDLYAKALKEKEDFWKNDELRNKSAYAEEIVGEDTFHEWMFQNKMGFLQDKLELQKKYGKYTLDTEIEIKDALNSENEYWNNKEKKQDKDLLKSKSDGVKDREELAREIANIMDKYGVDEAGRLKAQKDLELKIAKDAYDQGIIDAKQYAETIKKINENVKLPKWAEDTRDIAGGIANVASEFSGTMQGFQSAEEKSIETKYQKQIDAARKAGKDTTKIEEKKEKELAAIRAKNADSAFAVQIAMIASSTAEAAINAYASALKVPVIGHVLAPIAAAAAVTYGMSQVAQAKAARDAAKEGYYSGGWNTPDGGSPSGYTGGTDPREVRGVFPNGQPYHGQEFISNHHLTNNREMKPAFDLFDAAQRNGTAGSLTRKDLVKALSPSGGYYAGGWNGSSFIPMSPAGNDSSTEKILVQYTKAIERLNNRLDEPFQAYSVISGRNGLAEQTKRYEKLIKNANR
jgi:TP901 family phage tail tape measure protein